MSTKMNYAKALQSETVPAKDQAIIFDAINGVQIEIYAKSVGEKIGPENIRYISRISNNRICIYVATKEIADTLVDTHKQIKINEHQISIRPLISRNKRLILSNVPPIIPNSVIEQKLKESDINLVSHITTLRAGLNTPGYQHILSFRRQVYIPPDDTNKLPISWKIDFEDTSYWIYPSLDSMTCFICKEGGHIAKVCPTISETTTNQITEPQALVTGTPSDCTNQQEGILSQDMQKGSNSMQNPDSPHDPTARPHLDPTTKPKRPLSESSTDSSTLRQDLIPNIEFAKPSINLQIPKKRKVAPIPRITENEMPILPEIEAEINNNPSEYHCSYPQLIEFLGKTFGKENIHDTLHHLKLDPNALALTFRKLYPALASRKHKNRFTRMIRKLESGASTASESGDGNTTDTSTEDDLTDYNMEKSSLPHYANTTMEC